MCLQIVTSKDVIIEKDIVVWGVVRKINGVEKALNSQQQFNKRVNIAVQNLYKIGFSGQKAKGYKAGFHRYLKKRDAKDFCASYPLFHVRKFIIPKGEVVTLGQNYGGYYANSTTDIKAYLIPVVVSQKLINPRIELIKE